MFKVAIPSFIFGAAVGAVSAWFITSRKYEAIIQEEVDSVKQAFENQEKKNPKADEPKEEKVAKVRDKKDMKEYADILSKGSYTNYSSAEQIVKETPEIERITQEKPHVISPKDFGEYEDYETNTLTYFSDGVLVDDDYSVIHDVEDVVGEEALDSFGEYEDDAVHVRNDAYKKDYEILLDLRTYTEFIDQHPHKVEV